jgi:hypothetical protein
MNKEGRFLLAVCFVVVCVLLAISFGFLGWALVKLWMGVI